MSSQSAIHNPELELPTLRIAPSKGWVPLKLRTFGNTASCSTFLSGAISRFVTSRTALGATWAIIQPFFTMVVFSIFFGHLAKVPSDGIPYPLFSFAALVPWTFFANGLSQSSNSLVGSGTLITKVIFPAPDHSARFGVLRG